MVHDRQLRDVDELLARLASMSSVKILTGTRPSSMVCLTGITNVDTKPLNQFTESAVAGSRRHRSLRCGIPRRHTSR